MTSPLLMRRHSDTCFIQDFRRSRRAENRSRLPKTASCRTANFSSSRAFSFPRWHATVLVRRPKRAFSCMFPYFAPFSVPFYYSLALCPPLLFGCFYSWGKSNISPVRLHKILNIHKNGTFLVFNYNLFNHETTAKLYTEKCWSFMAWTPRWYVLE